MAFPGKLSRLSRLLFVAMTACTSSPAPPTPAPATLATAESLYADLRAIRDRIDVSIEAGRTGRNDATPFAARIQDHNALREDLAKSLATLDPTGLRGDDARALGIMRRTLARDLGTVTAPPASPGPAADQHRPAITTPARWQPRQTDSTPCESGCTPAMAGLSLIWWRKAIRWTGCPSWARSVAPRVRRCAGGCFSAWSRCGAA